MRICVILFTLLLVGCVNVDPNTGKTIPREGQKHPFAQVESRAEQLRIGLTKFEVITLLGSPAEKSRDGTTWVYLPERPAVLIPSRALKLTFRNDVLVEHGYSPIVLGQTL